MIRRFPTGLILKPTEPRKLVESCSVATSCFNVAVCRSTGSVAGFVLYSKVVSSSRSTWLLRSVRPSASTMKVTRGFSAQSNPAA